MKKHRRSPKAIKKQALEASRTKRRRSRTIERLEDRHMMAADTGTAPGLDLHWQSISSGTPEGQQAILDREVLWATMAQAAGVGADVPLELRSIPNDPYLPLQWHLINSGQSVGNPDYQDIRGVPGEDINIAPAWLKGYTGEGVVVAVVDSGVQLDHPDLASNIHPTLGFDAIDFDDDASPVITNPGTSHGTAVAGVIAGVGNNSEGITGGAYNAEIVPIRLIDAGQTPEGILAMFEYGAINDIDIFNHSWGPADVRIASGMSPAELQGIRDSIIFGRDGLGVIHVWASGNGAGPTFGPGFQSIGSYDSSNFDGYANSRYVIAVTGVDHDGEYANVDGTVTNYPEAGANVLVAAPTASFAAINIAQDSGIGSGIVTTDLTGDDGANADADPDTGFDFDRDFFSDPDYTTRFNGTSAAAPVASGAIALMLEANPNLSYRDVQEILVRSARQNAQFEEIKPAGQIAVPASTWITNANELFRNPDAWDPDADPVIAQRNPVADPTFAFDHFGQTPDLFTNGAGYTVSLGYGAYGEQIGYGHGVIDTDLAVTLAEQWHEKEQDLPPELTYTTFVNGGFTVPAAQVAGDAGNYLVPGLPGGSAWSDYYNEYFAEEPFMEPPFPPNNNGSPITLTMPDTPGAAMSMEWVEVKLSISGDLNSLDRTRITLVSPNGVHSELNNYGNTMGGVSVQSPNFGISEIPGQVAEDQLVWTFSTNRHWGERYDAAFEINPLTNEPYGADAGFPVESDWELHFENFGAGDINIGNMEVTWHGSSIGVDTKRIQGFVGVDDNKDTLFNFQRYIEQYVDIDDDGEYTRYTEVERSADYSQENFAENITVTATRASDGAVVGTFITGDDGNYYFDLPVDDYIISVEDPLGRTLADDPNAPEGFLAKYKSEWHVRAEDFAVMDSDKPVSLDPGSVSSFNPATDYDVLADEDGNPIPLLIDGTNPTPYHALNVNFLLEPADLAPETADFSGTVFADINSDGVRNADDIGVSGIRVYHDANYSGAWEAGEVETLTDATGAYTLSIAAESGSLFSIAVDAPGGWTPTNPSDGQITQFALPGSENDGLVFGVKPGSSSTGQTNLITGVVFNDNDGDGVRQATELGVSGFTVWLDSDNNGEVDEGERSTVTGVNGAYSFSNVTPGTHTVRVLEQGPWSQTFPVGDAPRVVSVAQGGSATGVSFGIMNEAIFDYGDLAGYPTTKEQNGARHRLVSGIYLGSTVDAEVNATPTLAADGDDAVGADEDGVTLLNDSPIVAGDTVEFEVTVNGIGGSLNAWVDFNRDGDWNDPGEHIFIDADLNPGTHTLSVVAPDFVDQGGGLPSRFRWGPSGLGYTGEAESGEVEDYVFNMINQQGTPDPLPGDYDQNGLVDAGDFSLWKSTFGSVDDLRADANHNGVVDAADYTIWRNFLGSMISATSQQQQTLAAETEAATLAAGLSSSVAAPLDASPTGDDAPAAGLMSLTIQGAPVGATGGSMFVASAVPTTASPVAPADESGLELLELAIDTLSDDEPRDQVDTFSDSDADTDSQELALAFAFEEDDLLAF